MKEMVINELKNEISNGNIPREKIDEIIFKLNNDNPTLKINQEDIFELLDYYDTFMSGKRTNDTNKTNDNVKKRVLINPILNNKGVSSVFFLSIITISSILLANIILYLSK